MPKFKVVYRKLVDYYFFVEADTPAEAEETAYGMDPDDIPADNCTNIENEGVEEIIYIDPDGNEYWVSPDKDRPDLAGKRVVVVRDVMYADDTGVNIELNRGDTGIVTRSILLPNDEFDDEALPVYIVATDSGLEAQCWYDEIEVIDGQG